MDFICGNYQPSSYNDDCIPSVVASPCPLCKSQITITKESSSHGMDGRYYDWVFRCNNCNMVETSIPADNFYGRSYCETIDEAITKWNEKCSKFSNT